MSVDEQSRHRLFNRLEEILGAEEASTLMDHLPPVGWADVATKRDLDHLAVATKRDLDHLAERLESSLLATFRGEMIVQTRTMIFALVGTVVSLVALVFAVIGLS